MKRPSECGTLDEIRREIDALDRQAIVVLGQRLEYVQAASAFKLNAQSIPAQDRVAAMLPERYRWARQAGLDPDFIQGIFRELIAYFIHEQITYWCSKTPPQVPTGGVQAEEIARQPAALAQLPQHLVQIQENSL